MFQIYTITVNRCRMWLRKEASRSFALASVEESESQIALQHQAIQQDHERKIVDLLYNAINELPEASRLVTTLYYMNGLTCKEIAEFTGTSINTVKSKLQRAREKLRKELTEMPAPAMTQQRVDSGFTTEVLRVLENLSPTPQPRGNPINRITWVPWVATLIIGLIAIGTKFTTPLGNRYDGKEIDKLTDTNLFWDDGVTVSLIRETEILKPAFTPPPVVENTLYAAVDESEPEAIQQPSGGLQCRLSPGDFLTYKIHQENQRGDRTLSRIEGTRVLFVKDVESNCTMHIVNFNQEKYIVPAASPSEQEAVGGHALSPPSPTRPSFEILLPYSPLSLDGRGAEGEGERASGTLYFSFTP